MVVTYIYSLKHVCRKYDIDSLNEENTSAIGHFIIKHWKKNKNNIKLLNWHMNLWTRSRGQPKYTSNLVSVGWEITVCFSLLSFLISFDWRSSYLEHEISTCFLDRKTMYKFAELSMNGLLRFSWMWRPKCFKQIWKSLRFSWH